MEPQPYALSMQKEMISEIEAAEPKYLVFVNIQASWILKKDSKRLIHEWFNTYSRQYYDMVGVVDIEDDETRYIWNKDQQGYKLKSPAWMSIYRKKD